MIFDSLFQLMADKKASDIFISAGTPIHIKIQGRVMPINQRVMEPAMIRHMVEEAVRADKLAELERERELNLSFGRRNLGNFRVNIFWQRGSLGVVARYIQSNIPTIEELSMPAVLSEIVMEKRGLVLVVGATGSGKSTTLASMLDHRNRNRSGHILTVEDPIEYLFEHKKSVVNQREVGIDTLGWAPALRNAMRQAPDCILIGEIRDRETMQAAISYAQSGHLCLATLHANNAYHALNRIINFFPLENRQLLYLDLAVALRTIISQRLVRTPAGGRMPAVEILMNTRHIADLIERGDVNEIKQAMEQSLAPGCQTFEQSLYELHVDGLITLDEALANADSATNLHWLINNARVESPAPTGHELQDSISEYEHDEEEGVSFQEFTLHDDKDERH